MTPITVIGSCRVYEPLVASGLTLVQDQVYGYTHNTCEHLQMLFLQNAGIPPTEALSETTLIRQNFKGFDGPPGDGRLFVIEISSIRILKYLSWYLQINRFFRFSERFASEKMDAVKFTDEETLKSSLEKLTNFPFDLDLLQYYEQAEVELLDDLRRLQRVLQGRVLFVPHFNTDKKGQPIWQRSRIHICLQRLQRETGAKIFDPTPHVKAFGLEHALIDLGHYSKPFEQRMSSLLSAAVQEACEALE